MSDVEEATTRANHDEWARVANALTRHFGDLDIAEEAAAEAFTTAVERHPPEPLGAVDDDRLRLIFTCCHPALAVEARLALTLAWSAGSAS